MWKPDALQEARDAQGMSIKRLAIEAKRSEKQLRRIEAGEVLESNDDFVYDVARALNLGSPKILAWRSHEEAAAAMAAAQAERLASASSKVRTAEGTRLAKDEAKLGLDKLTFKKFGKQYPVLGFNRVIECEMNWAAIRDAFVAQGIVRDGRPLTGETAAILDADVGLGAAYFRIQREIAELGEPGQPAKLPVTVFAPKSNHGLRLQDAVKSGEPVNALVHIVKHVSPDGKRVFPRLDGTDDLWPWAFVVIGLF